MKKLENNAKKLPQEIAFSHDLNVLHDDIAFENQMQDNIETNYTDNKPKSIDIPLKEITGERQFLLNGDLYPKCPKDTPNATFTGNPIKRNNGIGNSLKSKEIPRLTMPGEFDFIDDANDSHNIYENTFVDNVSGVDFKDLSDTIIKSTSFQDKVEFNVSPPKAIASITIPGDFYFIDDGNIPPFDCTKASKSDSTEIKSGVPTVTSNSTTCKNVSENSSNPGKTYKTDASKQSVQVVNKHREIYPSVVIPGDFCFIDDTNATSASRDALHSNSCSKSDEEYSSVIIPGNERNNSHLSKPTSSTTLPKTYAGETMSNPTEKPHVPPVEQYSCKNLVETISPNGSTGAITKHPRKTSSSFIEKLSDSSAFLNSSKNTYSNNSRDPLKIPSVIIPGDFDFIDETNAYTSTYKDVPLSLLNETNDLINCECPSPNKSTKSESFSITSPIVGTPVIFKIPSIYLPSNVQYIDEVDNMRNTNNKMSHRGEKTHSSMRIPRSISTKRNLCRHHSDSEAKGSGKVATTNPKHRRSRSRKVKRSVSAIETNKDCYRTNVKRSLSDRSGMIMAGKHLRPPCMRPRPHSHYEHASSMCSSTKTLSTNVSLSEIVAVEMGLKDIPGLTAKEARRRRIVCAVVVVTVTIVIVCVLLVILTLLLSPEIDAIRKSNLSF